MAYTNITGLFTDICDAIRAKGGAAGVINHQNIPDAILNISGGGGMGCDIGIIYLDPDPSKPGGGGGNNSSNGGGYGYGGGGNSYDYGNGGGGNNNSGPTYARAKIYISDNVYNMSGLFSCYDYSQTARGFLVAPGCGNNVLTMANAYNNNIYIAGPCVIGPNVIDYYGLDSVYHNCENVWGSVKIPFKEDEYGYYLHCKNAFCAFRNSGLNGSVDLGLCNGFTNAFNNTNITSVIARNYISEANGAFFDCNYLTDVVFKNFYNVNAGLLSTYLPGKTLNNAFGISYAVPRSLNFYVYNYSDYSIIKSNAFANRWFYPETTGSFSSDVTTNLPTNIQIPFNFYNVESELWENNYMTVNVTRMCNRLNSDGISINLYLVEDAE